MSAMADRMRKSARGNRLGLALTGGVLLAAGAAALAIGLGLFGGTATTSPLVSTPVIETLTAAWLPYAAAVGGVVLVVLAGRWLLVQGRSNSVSRVEVGSNPAEGASRVQGSVVCRAVADDIETYPGVRRARVNLTGRADEPRLRVNLVIEEDAEAAGLWQRCRTHALARARATLEFERLSTIVRMSVATPSSRQAERALA